MSDEQVGPGTHVELSYTLHDEEGEVMDSASTEDPLGYIHGYVQIVPGLSVEDGINAVRTTFQNCWFDADKCADGMQSLRRYRYEVDQATGQFSRKPLHDDASHGADALRYLAVALREPKSPTTIKPKLRLQSAGRGAWMG